MEKSLTLIIPTYNMERFLRHCLDSLLVREHIDSLEVLVINDGSKDSSLDIAREYHKRLPGVVRVIDKPNGNYGSCINRGLKEAKGRYVKILDADDSADTTGLDRFLGFLADTDADMVLSDYVQVNLKDAVTGATRYLLPPRRVLDAAHHLTRASLGILAMHGVAYRTSMLRDHRYTQTEGISYTDQEWAFLPLRWVRTVAYFDEVVYRYLTGRDGQTMQMIYTGSGWRQHVTVFRSLLNGFSDKAIPAATRDYLTEVLLERARFMYVGTLLKEAWPPQVIAEIDSYIRDNSPALYQQLENIPMHPRVKYPYIKVWRKRRRRLPRYITIPFAVAYSLLR